MMNNYTFDTSKFVLFNPELANKLNKEMQFNGLGFIGLGNVKIGANVAEAIVAHRGKVYRNLQLLRDYIYNRSDLQNRLDRKHIEDIYKFLTDVTSEIKFYYNLKRIINSFERQRGQISVRKTKYEVVK